MGDDIMYPLTGPRPVDASIPTYYGMVTGTEYSTDHPLSDFFWGRSRCNVFIAGGNESRRG